MANKYYYLVASLPYLLFEKKLPIAKERFLDECETHLADKDLALLAGLETKNPEAGPAGTGFVKKWKEFDAGLRAGLAEARSARKLSREERIHGPAKDILDQPTPLDMERRFERIRWEFLDGKETDYHFDLNWLMVYYLKIQILERLALFEEEEGKRIFEALSETAHG